MGLHWNQEFDWSDDRIAQFKQCVADGMSSGQAASVLGITRSAAIGKARRLKLVWDRARGEVQQKPVRKRPKRRGPPAWRQPPAQALAPVAAPEPVRAIPPAPNSKPVDLMGLTNSTCRWPITDGSPFMFCGALEADMGNGVPYCGCHTAAAIGRAYTRQERFEFRKGRG